MIVKINPMGKPRMTQRDRWKQRPVVLRYHEFCDRLRLAVFGDSTGKGLIGPEELYLEFYVPMPKSWSKKKRMEMEGMPHQQRPDIDNLCKAVMDALWEDDSTISFIEARKTWATEGGITLESTSFET